MVFLSGGVPTVLTAQPRPDLGVMLGPGKGNRAPLVAGLPWAADNACFTAGDRFDGTAWLAWLGTLLPWRRTCLFAVAPDVVGDAVATLERATPYLPRIRALGLPAAYVSQDDADRHPVPWDALDVLFVGGTTAWKLSERSWALCREAKGRGKRVHAGRVNSLRRLRACRAGLVDSVDGTQLAYRPDQTYPQLVRWLDAVNGQTVLVAS
jgi:hypothetical protein